MPDPEEAGITAMSEGFAAPSFAISLEPHGLNFLKPATLSLPNVDGLELPAVMHAAFDGADAWDPVGPMTVADGLVSVEIDGFSTYSLTVVRDGACPCFDAVDVIAFRAAGQDREADREFDHYYGDGTRGDDVYSEYSKWGSGWAYATIEAGGRHGSPSTCEASYRQATGLASSATDFFPHLAGASKDSYDKWVSYSWGSDDDVRACESLVLASIDHRAKYGQTVVVSVVGLSGAGVVTLTDAVTGVEHFISAWGWGIPVERGNDYSLSFTSSPDGFECAFAEGMADPFAGTADADARLEIACVALPPEVACNSLDDDADGEIDEGFPDTDGDELADQCDPQPDRACPGFTMDDVNGLVGETDQGCHWNAFFEGSGSFFWHRRQ